MINMPVPRPEEMPAEAGPIQPSYKIQGCTGGADVPLFETRIKTCMISVQIRLTALKFGIAVAFVKNNMEL
jgi:hypothetical protein